MKSFPLSVDEVSVFGAKFPGDLSRLEFDGENLLVPDDMEGEVAATIAAGLAALPNIKAQLRRLIDVAAEAERLKYITPGAGQAMTYAQKAEEARLCLAASGPVAEDYPLLAAEIGITAGTLIGVAEAVAVANAQWLEIGAAIEAVRLAAKKAVSEADTVEDAQAAVDAVVWP